MPDKEENLVNGIFLLTVLVLTIYSVFSSEDLSDIANTISEASPIYLLIGVGRAIFFIWAESAILHYLLGTLGIKTKRRAYFLYPSVGLFSSRITPSAGGGQPAQVYYMRGNMIPMPVATAVLMVVTVTYKSVLVVIGYLLVVLSQGFSNRCLYEVMSIYYLGLEPNMIFHATMLVLVFHTSPVRDMVVRVLGLLEHFRFLKRKTSRTGCLLLTMGYCNDMVAFLRQRKHVLLKVLFFIFCQRLVLFSVTYFVYRTFGLKGTAMIILMLLRSTISVPADMLPLPGGMGVSEHLFLTIFDPILYGDLLLSAMVLLRGIAYYVQLGFSTAVTMHVHIILVRKYREI